MVVKFSVGVANIDLVGLCAKLPFLEYNRAKFAAAMMRLQEPKTTLLIFSAGNMVCTGGKNMDETRYAARLLVRVLNENGYPAARLNELYGTNCVAGTDVRCPLRLQDIATEHSLNTSYEPQVFPGCVFRRFHGEKVVFLVFRTGKMVITGVQDYHTVQRLTPLFYEEVLQHFQSVAKTHKTD